LLCKQGDKKVPEKKAEPAETKPSNSPDDPSIDYFVEKKTFVERVNGWAQKVCCCKKKEKSE